VEDLIAATDSNLQWQRTIHVLSHGISRKASSQGESGVLQDADASDNVLCPPTCASVSSQSESRGLKNISSV